MTPDRAHVAGAVIGGLVAGLGLTALLLAGERKTGAPSELAVLERAAARKLGMTPAAGIPDAAEQAVIQGGHLMLSAAAGAAFAATVPRDAPAVPAGLAFGAAFYAAMHWIAGPLAGLKQPEWRAERATIGMHAANHAAFGVITALGAWAGRRFADGR